MWNMQIIILIMKLQLSMNLGVSFFDKTFTLKAETPSIVP